MNPLNADLHAMRSSLLYGGLETVLRNQNHKQPDLKLFEFGYTYQAGSKPNDKDPGYKEIPGLAIFITGRKDPEGWMSYGSQTDYYLLKGVVNKLIEKLGIGKPGIEVESLALPELVGQTWKILNKEVALVGEVEKSVLKKMGIKNPVYYALFNWAEVTSLLGTNTVRYQSLPKYPEARRDLSLLLDEAVEYGQIEKLAHKTEKKLLKAVNLFDVYQGKNLPSGKKSYAVSFVFRSDKKTLEDMEIDAIMKDLMETYKKKLGAEIR
jgi:phenylalanyl-tRNA synthetase beta chain